MGRRQSLQTRAGRQCANNFAVPRHAFCSRVSGSTRLAYLGRAVKGIAQILLELADQSSLGDDAVQY